MGMIDTRFQTRLGDTLFRRLTYSIEAAKEVAASSIAQERNIDIETVRRGIVWTE